MKVHPVSNVYDREPQPGRSGEYRQPEIVSGEAIQLAALVAPN